MDIDQRPLHLKLGDAPHGIADEGIVVVRLDDQRIRQGADIGLRHLTDLCTMDRDLRLRFETV